jgi:hypothetical protein
MNGNAVVQEVVIDVFNILHPNINLSNFHRINGCKLKNEFQWFCTIKYPSNCITPFLKTQLVDVEILVIVLLRMGNFGLMAVSMIVWV